MLLLFFVVVVFIFKKVAVVEVISLSLLPLSNLVYLINVKVPQLIPKFDNKF